jgi:endonuclease/exonuclease/phosphatase (EEP) superfamily protein YafD
VPTDDVIMRVVSAGFVDQGATQVPEATTSQDGRRIDYVFTAGDLSLVELRTPAVTASDHRPVIATLTLGP